MEWSRYLADERIMMFHPFVAKALGLNEAIFLQQLHYWLNRKPHIVEEKSWIYNPYRAWQEQLCFMSENTIKRTIKNLTDKGIVVTANFNKSKFDRTLWYSIDYDKLDELVNNIQPSIVSERDDDCINLVSPLAQNDTMEDINLAQPIPSNNTSGTTSTNNIIDIYVEEEKNELTQTQKPIVKINFDLYMDEFNQRCTNLPKVSKITEKRKTAIRRFNIDFNLEDFKTVCDLANQSPFLIGENERGWKADFDFLLRVDKATAILEGTKYNGKKKSSGDKLLDMINGGVFDD